MVQLGKGGLLMVDFGDNLRNLRVRDGLTQEYLAKKLGVTKSTVSAYETGTKFPSHKVLLNIIKIFNVSSDYLLGIESKNNEIDLSGLTEKEAEAVINLIKAMKDR